MLNCRLGASFRPTRLLCTLVRGAKKCLERPDVMRGGLTKYSSAGIKLGSFDPIRGCWGGFQPSVLQMFPRIGRSNDRTKRIFNSVSLSLSGCQFSLQRKHQLPNYYAHAGQRKCVAGASQTEHLRPLQTSTSGENNAGQFAEDETTVPPGTPGSAHEHG